MYSLRLVNNIGASIKLTQNESNYQIVSISGLNPPTAEVYTTPIAFMDGGKYKSSKVQMRNVVITIRLNGAVEANRLLLYSICRIGGFIRVYYENGSRSVYVDGYIENIDNNPFSISEQIQLSILCPQPYWKAATTLYYDVSQIVDGFTFPFAIEADGIPFSTIDNDRIVSIVNKGNVESGVIIEITANGNGIENLKLVQENTGDYFIVETTLNVGDVVRINSYKGEKNITINGESAFNVIGAGSNWLTLLAGDNTFSYTADANPDLASVIFEVVEMYEGV